MRGQKLIAMLLGCSMLMSVGGCGKKETTSDGKVTITIGNWPNAEANPKMYENAQESLKRFNEAYPDINVITDEYAYDTQTFAAKAEGGTLPTLYTTYFTEADKIMDAGYAADITDQLKKIGWDSKLNEYILDNISKDGKIYMVPTTIYSLGLCLNLDLFEQAGLMEEDGTPKAPQTFEELAETAKTIKEKTGKAGIVFPTTDNAGGWIFTSVAWNFGTKFMEQKNGKWTATFNSPECAAALQYIKDLKWKYDVLPSSTLVNNADTKKFVGTNQAAMTISAPDICAFLVNNYQLDKEKIGFAKMPAGPKGRISLLGGGLQAISPNATPEQIDACFKWLTFGGLSPDPDDNAKDAMKRKMETDKANNNLIGLKDMILWNEKSTYAQYRNELIDEYRNVNENHIKLYNDQADMEFQSEEPVCAQDLYGILDGCIQEVLNNQNADPADLLEKAASDFQQNFLDYE